ncbi:hypothetical protein ACFCVO_00210 [Agromyces sp. NPDC056379]|uniref:hypothetical protein n=1 Tax=unclassified Agromyces TaxID=2639701 RepID=UPI0035D86200
MSFPLSSRYHAVAEIRRTMPDGTVVVSLARRVIPAVERYVPMEVRRVDGSERPDTLADDAYDDPALWWRIVDASGEVDPAELTATAGRLVIIPLPLEVTS